MAAFVIGVTLVSAYEVEKDVKMSPGDTVSLGQYRFVFNGVREQQGPNYVALIGDVDLLHKDKLQRKLGPEKRFYMASGMPMTEAAIDTGFLRDVYVSLGEPIERDKLNGAWVVRVYLKPFVDWIWGGCLLMSLGGLLAICDRRYRVWKK